ncbi:MAG: hypothetical protein IPM97_12045 [Bdellovibrionaceae bacterium]|nr:hypothetical protein [Pseudobdellovibrionaceae bacterium]
MLIAAAVTIQRGQLLINGGGHNDFNGNAVYGFSLYSSENPKWQLIRPSTSPPVGTDPTKIYPDTCPNGDPTATHTYNQIIYDEHNDKLVLCGLSAYFGGGGISARIRALDLTTKTWDPYSSHPAKPVQGSEVAAVYDSKLKIIWDKGAPGGGPHKKKGGGGGFPFRSDGFSLHQDAPLALDPNRRILVAIGGYAGSPSWNTSSTEMVLWDLTSSTSVKCYEKSALAGFPAGLKTAKIGLEFHPPSGSFVAWSGGTKIYRLIPPATNPFSNPWTFETKTASGKLPNDVGSGVYGRFRWAPYPGNPAKGVFVMSMPGPGSDGWSAINTYIYKPDF